MFRKIIKGLKDVWCGTLEFDTEPKNGSFNPVTSDGVYKAINGAGGAKEIVYFDVDPSDPPSGIYEAIGEALSNNKEPVIKNDGNVYFYSSTSTEKYIFVGGYGADVVGYTTLTVSGDDSIVEETVDVLEGKYFPLYYHQNDDGFTVADKTGHALTKTEIADAYRAGQIFMFSSYPASNTQAHWGYCCDIKIDSDNTGYAEFFILSAFAGDSYSWEKYRINLSSSTEFVTLWGPNTSYSTGYSGHFADGATTVSVSTSQNFNSTQKAQGRDNIGAASASDVSALQSQVSSLSDVSAYSVKGEATVAQLNAGPSGIQAGWAYQLTDSGTLTNGSLAVVAGDTVAWDGTKWFPLVKSDYYATKTYAQNVAHSIAPEFDQTKPNDAGGYAYYADEIVSYNGATYRFKVNHSSGAWNAAEVDRYEACESLKFFNVVDIPGYLFAIEDKDKIFLLGIKKDGSVEWQKGIPEPLKKALAEKVDKEIGKSLIDSVFANGVSVKQLTGYLFAVVDKNDNFLFGIKDDGSLDWQKGVAEQFSFLNGVSVVSLDGYLFAITDKDGKFLFGIKEDGSIDWQKGVPVPLNFVFNLFESAKKNGLLEFKVDSNGNLVFAIKENGEHVFYTPVNFNGGVNWSDDNLYQLSSALKARGIDGGQGDWSDNSSLKIPKPRCAVVNFKNIVSMPTTKTQNFHGVMQFWDMAGNYFEKKVIMNAQGNSSLSFPKKNISIDICNDEWVGDDTFKLKIGDWVSQDSFHLKAYYTEYFRGKAAVGYELFNQIQKTKGLHKDVPWKEALIDQSKIKTGAGQCFSKVDKTDLQLDTGARNHPLGFPCAVYLNGSFYGIFAWQLKKHRDNYHQNKNTLTHIHLDGDLGIDEFWGGAIDWTAFEVRNPKGLKDVDGNKYDGDNPKELSGTDANSAAVKARIVALSQSIGNIDDVVDSYGINSTEFKDAFEEVFDVDNLIDYIILMDVIGNHDAFRKNWQWVTYDGVKWYANVYDLDGAWGSEASGKFLKAPYQAHVNSTHGIPTSFIFENDEYTARLKTRYSELRKSVVTYDNIVSLMQGWMDAIGIDYYTLEYDAAHWKESPCNRDAEVDEHWELVRDDGGYPVMGQSSTYRGSTAYSVDDEVFYGAQDNMGYYKFKCVSPSTGNAPISQLYFKDNIYSFANWVKAELENMDIVYDFNN